VLENRLGLQSEFGGCVVNRKLIRPTLAEVRERGDRDSQHRRQANDPNRKRVPPEQTHAESFYYKKQMDNRTQMVIVLQDGEELRGSIEWYDRGCIKLHRTEGPNLLVLKHNVKYMYKTEDAEGNGDGEDRNEDRIEESTEE
jgi:host factor-I protein